MNGVTLLQQVYPNRGYLSMIELTFNRHASYCEQHNIDYRFISTEHLPVDHGAWDKVVLCRDLLLKGYKLVIWLDADAIIWDLKSNLRLVPNPENTIGVALLPGPHDDRLPVWKNFPDHYNVGVMYFRNGGNTLHFIDEWLKTFPKSIDHKWREQQTFNELAKCDETVYRLPDTYNYTVGVHSGNDNPIIRGYHNIHRNKKLETMKYDLQVRDNHRETVN